MTKISYKYYNPNDYFRTYVKKIYGEAKKIAALNSLFVEVVFEMILNEIKKNNFELYVRLLQVMFLDYSISLVSKENVTEVIENENEDYCNSEEFCDDEEYDEDEEENLEDIYEIESTEDLINFAQNNKYVVASMASSIDVREIDIASVYENMENLSEESKKMLAKIYPCIIFDYIEMKYPFILGKLHSNLKTNEFTKEISAKSVSIIDLLDVMSHYASEDYVSMIVSYLEIYYKHKKYNMEYFDSIVTKKERELLKILEGRKLFEALLMVMNDDDLLETVINVYSENYFGNGRTVMEVERYYSQPKKEEEINLIFRNKKGKE